MAENENDWDLWAVVRRCSNMNNSVHDDTRNCYNVNTSVLVDHNVHEDPTHGNSANNTKTPTLLPDQSDCVGDFSDSFAMGNKRYFGLDEVCSLSKNSRIEPHNSENQTETIPNTPLLLVEHEEEKKRNKKARYSMQSSSIKEGKSVCYRGKSTERYEILAEKLSEADQWRWKKYGMKRTGGSPFLKSYYRCNEVQDCPARRHVQQSSTDSNKVVVTYRGQHNHPPNQHIVMVNRSHNAAAPVEDPSFPSSTSTMLFN
ncbi:probable WRKY transcription factor 15 [Lycium barbarum]|uniref:probable WRKY transcription factor 15 n=1 Tax=Lycium barbarum TaxID=112863 RepID=UPI00293F5C15|nr:probable WRKY transcription factor 15 [Lycium barbarum]